MTTSSSTPVLKRPSRSTQAKSQAQNKAKTATATVTQTQPVQIKPVQTPPASSAMAQSTQTQPVTTKPTESDLSTRFQVGDEVQHPKRPEWGTGHVHAIAALMHEGERVQRVTVDFVNHKRVTLNTGIAPLKLKHRPEAVKLTNPLREPPKQQLNGHSFDKTNDFGEVKREEPIKKGDSGWLDALESKSGIGGEELWSLPDGCTDPFASPEAKLTATLDTFRFSTEAKALIDWAVCQTGLDDPLTKYTRHEMEMAFPRFERDRNQHLFSLVRDFKHRNQLDQVHKIADKVGHASGKAQIRKILKG